MVSEGVTAILRRTLSPSDKELVLKEIDRVTAEAYDRGRMDGLREGEAFERPDVSPHSFGDGFGRELPIPMTVGR